ncbi:MAG: acetolactate synthase small subunit [Pseudomonadota bacterium]
MQQSEIKGFGHMRHIISIILQNEAGALTRVAGLFSTRGYNIETLNVAPTADQRVSRISLVTKGPDAVIAQICSQLLKLVDVVDLVDLTDGPHFERELLLLKMRVSSERHETLEELVNHRGGRVLDERPETFTLEYSASGADVDRFIEVAARHGEVLTLARSGPVAASVGEPRTPWAPYGLTSE